MISPRITSRLLIVCEVEIVLLITRKWVKTGIKNQMILPRITSGLLIVCEVEIVNKLKKEVNKNEKNQQ